MSYTHFTTSERSQLYKLRSTDNLSMSAIATLMNRSKHTISRELKRNTDEKYQVYFPDTAEAKMTARRAKSKGRFKRISDPTIAEIKQRLEHYHCPEQLAGRMKFEGLGKVSYETIYHTIYANHQGLGFYK